MVENVKTERVTCRLFSCIFFRGPTFFRPIFSRGKEVLVKVFSQPATKKSDKKATLGPKNWTGRKSNQDLATLGNFPPFFFHKNFLLLDKI